MANHSRFQRGSGSDPHKIMHSYQHGPYIDPGLRALFGPRLKAGIGPREHALWTAIDQHIARLQEEQRNGFPRNKALVLSSTLNVTFPPL